MLSLYCHEDRQGEIGGEVKVYAIGKTWSEEQVTWYERESGARWDREGVDHEGSELASTVLPRYCADQWVDFEVTSGVSTLISDTSTAFGFLLMIQPTSDWNRQDDMTFRSSQFEDEGTRPTLEVKYLSYD